MRQDIVSVMTSLGFSAYEARAYAALVREHPLTGYELSGRSGIPRSKIYECIERLTRKEMIIPVEGTPMRYVPVPPEEVVRRLASDFERSIDTLSDLLRHDTNTEQVDYVFNITGHDAIIEKALAMISTAVDSLDLSLWDEEIERLRDSLDDAAARGVRIRLLSFGKAALDSGETYRHRELAPEEVNGRWITVVMDRAEALTGQCTAGDDSVAAWTRNRNLVFMSLKYIEHEIIKIREQDRS